MGDIFRKISHDEIGKRFSKASSSYRNWAIPQKEGARILINSFGKYISPSDGVLDAGAGIGLLTEELLKISKKVFACDLSLESLIQNPAALKFLCNMEEMPLRGKFDWIVSNFALHWSDWRKSLSNFDRYSSKGFFFSVPVKGSLEGIGFPFPEREEILDFVKPSKWFVKEIEIPFRGKEFLMFFKRTGTGFNPNKTLSAFEILKNPSAVKNYSFKVLFLLKEKRI
jgi:malonyl-CoA O-methyltransferase